MPTRINDHTLVLTGVVPTKMYARSSRPLKENKAMAGEAVVFARTLIPKLSGTAAKGLIPYYTEGRFGFGWSATYLWYQEAGIRPFTMTKIAGKVIPMWIDDPTGAEHRKNPKAKRRVTASGRRQILIFRKAAKIGQRKRVARRDTAGNIIGWRDVPASYPGAPGRISHRQEGGRIAGKPPKSTPHVGVRWRHPGLTGRAMLQHALLSTAQAHGLRNTVVYAESGGR